MTALIVLLDDKGAPYLYSHAGFDDDFKEMVAYLEEGRLPPCYELTFSHDNALVITDRNKECSDCPLSRRCVFTRSLCVNLNAGEKNYGFIAVSLPKEFLSDSEELNLFTEMAGDIAYALYVIEEREKNMEIEESRRLILELMPDTIVRIDRQGEYLSIMSSPAVKLVLPESELTGRKISDVLPGEASGLVMKALDDAFLTGSVQTVEYELEISSEKYWFEARIIPSGRDEAIAMIRDITSNKRFELKLMNSEERYRSMLDQAADAIFVHNMSGRILDVNRQAFASLGYTRVELISMYVEDLDPEGIQEGKHRTWKQVFAGERHTFKSYHKRKDGSSFPVEIRLGPVNLPSGRAILAIARNISGRRQAQKKIEEQLDELQRWQDVMLGREERVQELKREVNELCLKTGEPLRYPSQEKG